MSCVIVVGYHTLTNSLTHTHKITCGRLPCTYTFDSPIYYSDGWRLPVLLLYFCRRPRRRTHTNETSETCSRMERWSPCCRIIILIELNWSQVVNIPHTFREFRIRICDSMWARTEYCRRRRYRCCSLVAICHRQQWSSQRMGVCVCVCCSLCPMLFFTYMDAKVVFVSYDYKLFNLFIWRF